MRSKRLTELVVFAMLGALMYATKAAMEALPNIHLLGVFIAALTIVYRAKALIPIYVYVFLDGLLHGFSTWWVPYLYIWTVLWAFVMLVPKKLPLGVRVAICAVLSALHGLSFGALYAPFHALIYGLGFSGMITWITTGFVFDILHCVGNLACGILILPLVRVLELANKSIK